MNHLNQKKKKVVFTRWYYTEKKKDTILLQLVAILYFLPSQVPKQTSKILQDM